MREGLINNKVLRRLEGMRYKQRGGAVCDREGQLSSVVMERRAVG